MRKMKLDVDEEWKLKGIQDGFIEIWNMSSLARVFVYYGLLDRHSFVVMMSIRAL